MKISRRTNPLGINERRKVRYHSDPSYRQHVVETKRERWRKWQERDGRVFRNCLEREGVMHVYGRTRTVHTSEGERTFLTFSGPEVAALLGYHRSVIRKWQNDGRFPEGPYVTARNDAGAGARQPHPPKGVFSKPQVLAMLRIMGEHQKTCQYLYTRHTSVSKALHAAVKLSTHNTQHGQKTKIRKGGGQAPAAQRQRTRHAGRVA